MMKLCNWSSKCDSWAQWLATYPDKTKRLLCNKHCEELKREKGATDIKFVFVGATPLDINERVH